MTRSQASLRNWQKARLMGFNLNHRVLTEDEVRVYEAILILKDSLLSSWDSQTVKLLGHELPPHKCDTCGKRSTITHHIHHVGDLNPTNYCAKHYKIYSNELRNNI